MNEDKLKDLATFLTQNKLIISVAESCTGGKLANTLTSLSGASVYFDRGYVTYSNQSKIELLGVDAQTIANYGAVSEEVAAEMVKGVINNSGSDFAIAITGIAGPTGGSEEKPVGTVCFGFSIDGDVFTIMRLFRGDRLSVISQSVDFSIKQLKTILLRVKTKA